MDLLKSTHPAKYIANSRYRVLLVPSAARGLALAFLVVAAGCAPAITHGPRVGAGTAGGGSIALALTSAAGEYPAILPPSVLFLRHGWAADSMLARPGVMVGAQITPFILFGLSDGTELGNQVLEAGELDFYVQAPRGNPRGAGIILSRHVLMPYVQYGKDKSNEDSWYTTQGVAVSVFRNYEAVYWAPSIAYREVGLRGRHAAHFQLGAALGFARSGFARERNPLWMLSAGLVIELNESQPEE